MHKPNSAIERIKNHLAYKLGKVMIDFSHQRNNYKYGGGYIALFKKLYKMFYCFIFKFFCNLSCYRYQRCSCK